MIQRNENIYKIFDNEFRVIEKKIDINKIKNDFYGITSQIFIEKNYPNCFRFLYKKIQNKKIYFLENREINNEILIVENNINKSISIAKVQDYYIYDFYFYNNIIYLLYLNMNKGNDYKLIEIDEANNKNVTNLKAYSCQLVCINNTVCLICDLPKNYTASQKKLKNQELMGNSTIMVLK